MREGKIRERERARKDEEEKWRRKGASYFILEKGGSIEDLSAKEVPT